MTPALLVSLLCATPFIQPNSSGLGPAELFTVRNHDSEEFREALELCRIGEFKMAFPAIQKHADERDLGAVYILAKFYEKGLGVLPDREKAAALYDTNVTASHAPSMVALGELKEDKSPEAALRLYHQASDLEDPIADLKLGDIYERGALGTDANPKLAFSHFEKLSKTNFPEADFRLARCYDAGIGTSADPLQATRLFRKAALGGHLPSQVIMARRYFGGKGLDPDPIAAVGWLTLASQHGSPEARILLGLRYENGDAIRKDLNMAGQLYSAAATQGQPEGLYHLARLYHEGIGTKPDPVRAYVLLSQAGAFPPAQELLSKVEKSLSSEQLDLARKKLAEKTAQEKQGDPADTTP